MAVTIRPTPSPAELSTTPFTVSQPTVIVFRLRVYPVTGKPTITATLINRMLAAYHSPAAGYGQALYYLGVTYGIDPVYALAFFWHESRFGATGEARNTHTLIGQ
jgi:hypothetical protein